MPSAPLQAPSCGCHYDHGKEQKLVGLFSCAYDEPHNPCGYCDAVDYDSDTSYEY